MIKKIAIIMLLAAILAGCADQFPPTPPPPGIATGAGGAVAGAMPNWAAAPRNAVLTPTSVKLGDSIMLTVSEYEYIYNKAYYYDSQRNSWEPFSLQGEVIQDWIKGNAVASMTVTEAKFAPGENYILAYACNKVSGNWDCNGNRWMLMKFDAVAPEVPKVEVTGVEKHIIPNDIESFEFQSMAGEPDNFESIIVTRYDARYRSSIDYTFVLAHVFEFDTKAELDETIRTLFKDIISYGGETYNGHFIALFLDEYDNRVAVWTSGNNIIYLETHKAEYASKEIIEAYLKKYPSSLTKP
ncbi:hypothetical protein KY329_04055 [Candidatus Woesearchaeota archaeon]|nr:hypothetical protein [Candidatus Woesearchaeota archaeon]